MTLEIVPYPDDEQRLYIAARAAYLARVSLDFWLACMREGLIEERTTPQGRGFNWTDIRRVEVVRRLHEDLELQLAAIEIVLHLREKVEDRAARVRELEQEIQRRETEIDRLKKMLTHLRKGSERKRTASRFEARDQVRD